MARKKREVRNGTLSCKMCSKWLPFINFYKKRLRRGYIEYDSYCKSCSKLRSASTVGSSPESMRRKNNKRKEWRSKKKIVVISYYTNLKMKCERCGFGDIRALTVDHIDGGGFAHRKSIGNGAIYEWLIRNNFPEGFQILCMNCQFIKRVENNECTGSEYKHPLKYIRKDD